MVNFELVTLDGVKFRETVHEVILPTVEGEIAVFTHHAPLVSIATHGAIAIRRKEKDPDDLLEYYATNGGVIEVLDNTVRLLADEATHSEEINEAEEKAAYERALKLKVEAKDLVSLDKAQSLIDRQAVRLKVAELKRHRKARYR